MEQINVTTQFGNAVFVHSKDKVLSMRGPDAALAQWNAANDSIIYGTYGHIFNPNNCLFGDLCTALLSVFGRDSLMLTDNQKAMLEQEAASIPADAIP